MLDGEIWMKLETSNDEMTINRESGESGPEIIRSKFVVALNSNLWI